MRLYVITVGLYVCLDLLCVFDRTRIGDPDVIKVHETVIFFILVAVLNLFHTSDSVLIYSLVVRNCDDLEIS
jgi:hypothetical protein